MSTKRAAALLLLCTVLRVVSLYRPCLSDDEAIYAVTGREMLSGHALYRDVVDHKPPAVYVINELTQATGGMVLLHALLILVVWATGLLLSRIVRRDDPRAAWLAALLWCVFTTTLVDVDALAANCELWMMLPLVGSVVAFLEERLVLAGALVAIAMLFKYQAGIQLPLYAVTWIAMHRTRSLAGLAALFFGAAIPIVATIGAFAVAGTLGAARFWFLFNFSYIDAGPALGERIVRLLVRGGLVVGSAALLYGCALGGVRTAWASSRGRFILGWVVVSALCVGVGGRFFGHYFHQLTAPLCVLAAPVALRWFDRRWFVAALAIPAAAFLVLGMLHDRVMAWAGEPDPDYTHVIAKLDAIAPRTGSICIWGNSPVLYFEAKRPLGCRFTFANYLTGLVAGEPRADAAAHVVPAAWVMFDDDLAHRRPDFIVDGSPGNIAFYGEFPPEDFPSLAHSLHCEYRDVGTVDGMRIFERLAVAACR
jgi:hypothetical protein